MKNYYYYYLAIITISQLTERKFNKGFENID